MVPARLREVRQCMVVEVHAAGRELVQQRLPQVGARAVHQRDAGAPPAAEPVAQPRRQFQAPGPTPHDHDLARGGRQHNLLTPGDK
ncbi:hypothetical protein D3C83_87540 [compost metagenome]